MYPIKCSFDKVSFPGKPSNAIIPAISKRIIMDPRIRTTK